MDAFSNAKLDCDMHIYCTTIVKIDIDFKN